jgi:hypothetical protein
VSLRKFHLVFILLAIVGADLFGAWAVWTYPVMRDRLVLALGVLAVLGGFGLVVYSWRLVRSLDALHVR